jgi:putative PIG3 family NAD(P)H quinone oxidoreductase
MRAAVNTKPGDASVVEVQDVAVPVLGSEEVLVNVAFAGLNRADILERKGLYGPPDPSGGPSIPGLEYSGTIASVGTKVRGRNVGERVFGIATGGAHAERIAVPAPMAMRLPDEIDFKTAAAIPEAFMTAWDALFRIGGFRLGQTAVIHAVGSGVGLAALALVKAAGGFAVGTSRTEDKLRRATELGLDRALLLDDDWHAAARALGAGRGADVVLDFIGPSSFERNCAAVAPGGRIVQIGTLGGASGATSFRELMGKRASLVGTVLRARPLDEKIALARDFEAHAVPLFARGILHATIDRVFPLTAIRDAHTYMEANSNFGKVLIAIA